MRGIAQVDTGLYSGLNDFFYMTHEEAKDRGIEPEYLLPLLKSPRSASTILVRGRAFDTLVFFCRKSKRDLKMAGHTGALRYIEWGERQVTVEKQKVRAGVPWPHVPSVRFRKPGWWAMKSVPPTRLFMLYGYNDRFIQPLSDVAALSDRRFHMVRPFVENIYEPLCAVLNSTLVSLFIELAGRCNLGQGALDFATVDANKICVPQLKALRAHADSLTSSLKILGKRPVGNIYDEVARSDRRDLDSLVFDILGLTPGERDAVYEAIVDLVRKRLSKAESV
jgi:hypothetical protein